MCHRTAGTDQQITAQSGLADLHAGATQTHVAVCADRTHQLKMPAALQRQIGGATGARAGKAQSVGIAQADAAGRDDRHRAGEVVSGMDQGDRVRGRVNAGGTADRDRARAGHGAGCRQAEVTGGRHCTELQCGILAQGDGCTAGADGPAHRVTVAIERDGMSDRGDSQISAYGEATAIGDRGIGQQGEACAGGEIAKVERHVAAEPDIARTAGHRNRPSQSVERRATVGVAQQHIAAAADGNLRAAGYPHRR